MKAQGISVHSQNEIDERLLTSLFFRQRGQRQQTSSNNQMNSMQSQNMVSPNVFNFFDGLYKLNYFLVCLVL